MIEFAMVAPVLFLFMMGIIEISLILYAQSVMEGAAFNASRTGKTGYIADSVTREETITGMLHQRAHSLMDVSKISIDSVVYNQFDQIGQAEPFTDVNGNGVRDMGENYTDVNGNGQYDEDMGLAGLGSASQIVVYTVNYPWRIYTPMIDQFLGDDGVYVISSRAVVQNEPY